MLDLVAMFPVVLYNVFAIPGYTSLAAIKCTNLLSTPSICLPHIYEKCRETSRTKKCTATLALTFPGALLFKDTVYLAPHLAESHEITMFT